MYVIDFCKRLSQLRTLKGVSAREMSLALEQNASYINHIENSQTLPSMRGYFYICEYFKITPHQYFEFDNLFPNRHESITRNLKKLTNQEVDSLDIIIQSMISKG